MPAIARSLRRGEALKLYFMVLEALLVAEGDNGGVLLSANKFHAGLVMCSLEVS